MRTSARPPFDRDPSSARLYTGVVAFRIVLRRFAVWDAVRAALRGNAGIVASEVHLLLHDNGFGFAPVTNQDPVQVADRGEGKPFHFDAIDVNLTVTLALLQNFCPSGSFKHVIVAVTPDRVGSVRSKPMDLKNSSQKVPVRWTWITSNRGAWR